MGDSLRILRGMLASAFYLAFLGIFCGMVVGVFLESVLIAVGPIEPSSPRGGSDGKIAGIAVLICIALGFVAGLGLGAMDVRDGDAPPIHPAGGTDGDGDGDADQLTMMGAVAGAVAAGLAAAVAGYKQGMALHPSDPGVLADVWLLGSLTAPFRHMLVFGIGSAAVGAVVAGSLGLVFGTVFAARNPRPAFPVRSLEAR